MKKRFNDNPLYYSTVERLAAALDGADARLLNPDCLDPAKFPLVLRLGSSRSGSTLFTQWAATTGTFAYPTNVMALFQRSPLVGGYVQALMTDPRFRLNGEFDDLYGLSGADSTSGKTKGAASPHEFWGFWLNYFTFPRTPIAPREWAATADFDSFIRDVNTLISFFERPFLLKGHGVTHYLSEFANSVPNAVYVHMYRDPIDVIVSVLKARVTRYGDPDYFFGWRPPEYELLISQDRVRQVAGQVYFNERALIKSTPDLDDRFLLVSYDRLCTEPASVYSDIHALVARHSVADLPSAYLGPKSYRPSTADPAERAEAARALRYWTTTHGPLVYSDGSEWGDS